MALNLSFFSTPKHKVFNKRETYETHRRSSSTSYNKMIILVAVIVLLLVIYGVAKSFGLIFASY